MADKIERIIADTFLQMAEGLETGNFGKKPDCIDRYGQ